MKLPNILTLSRIPILFGVVILLHLEFWGARTGAFLLFVIGALTDWADGYYARNMGLVSNFGKLMDALTDKVFMVGLFIVLVVTNILPGLWSLFLLLMILSREFLITGLRLVAASAGIVLAAEKTGKYKTVTQIIAVVLLLLSEAIRSDFAKHVPEFAYNFLFRAGVAFFVLATIITVASGVIYLVKYKALFKEEKGEKSA